MNSYFVFVKKEILESVRTYRLFLLVVVFFVLGVMSPISAKFLPELVSSMMPDNMQITLPEPSALDAWMQFFKNIPQIGMIILCILCSGLLSTELSKGTLILVLTKGLSRSAVLLAKYTVTALVWTAGLVVSFGLTWGYTVYLFPGEHSPHLLFSVFCLWVFGLLLLSVILLGAALVRTNYGCLLITAAAVGILFLCNIIPAWQRYNPLSLASSNTALIAGTSSPEAFAWPLALSAGAGTLFVLCALFIFRKKQL